MAKTHRCKGNDHIAGLVLKYRFSDWKTIWDDKANKKLKGKRKNPCVLFKGDKSWKGRKGDVVRIPDKKKKEDGKKTDKDYKFKVPKNKPNLNLRILHPDFTPVKNAKYELKINGRKEPYSGKTTGDGEIIVKKIPRRSREGALVVHVPPPDIKDDSSKDGDEKVLRSKVELKGEMPVTWNLKIGGLNPIMEEAPNKWCYSGVQQRLNNLGINSGPVDGKMGPNTKAAVETFQCLFELEKDGKPGQKETQPKLVEVHDKKSYKGSPKGKIEDISPIPARKKKKTTEDDIAFVAPHIKDAGEFELYNNLVIRPTYRISLKLGDIENLFLNKPDSDLGRMERLQVLGLFYFPLNHKMAKTAFKGIAGPPKAMGAWEYFKTEILKNSDDAAADKEIQKRLEEWVVQKFDGTKDGAIYNQNGKSKGGGALPEPCPEDDAGKITPDEKKAHFAKIRVPGGFTYIHKKSGSYIYQPNHDDKYPMNMTTANLRKAQDMCYHDNPVLGAIPLIATVEQYQQEKGEWAPAPNVTVYFQLVEPYKIPDYDAKRDPDKQLNRPALRPSNQQTSTNSGTGPAKQDAKMATAYPAVADDPQVDNCHSTFGGKRGKAVAGNVFELKVDMANHKKLTKTPTEHDKKARPGFYAAHTGDRADAVKEPFFQEPETAPGAHKHAVKSNSNKNGQAGLIFKPSPSGGDRYRIRAYIDPPPKEGDTEADKQKVMVETGTFVVWR
ncbi:MAG: peptidoglycan-binding protein, partial [Deltaproteobacteria bacterium]|nr:peptidoglycan-binding protein [Deltaproteobacteria bacterium]